MTLVALLGELPQGVGDDFGGVAVDAPGGQLLGDRERVEDGVNPLRPAGVADDDALLLRETTSVIVAVQEPPRLSVMRIGAGRGSASSG